MFMEIIVGKLFILYLTSITAVTCNYKHKVKNVLNFIKEEHKLKYLSVVAFDSNETNIQRMIYKISSSDVLSKEKFYFSINNFPSHRRNGSLSQKDKDGKKNIHDNTIALTTFQNSESWTQTLNFLSTTKVKSSILLFVGEYDGSQWQIFNEMLNNLSKNSMFYLAYSHPHLLNELVWYRVITLTGYDKAVVHRLKFDASKGKVIRDYDMHGLHIVSITETWAPYFTLIDCTPDKKNCKSKGYLTDVMNILGSMMNFTWESHGEIDGNWGTTAISGPSNSKGEWGGVVGNVFYGTYQLSIR